MLHRAIVGSLERFIGILIAKNHAGALPTCLRWQVVIANISQSQVEYAAVQELKNKDLGCNRFA